MHWWWFPEVYCIDIQIRANWRTHWEATEEAADSDSQELSLHPPKGSKTFNLLDWAHISFAKVDSMQSLGPVFQRCASHILSITSLVLIQIFHKIIYTPGLLFLTSNSLLNPLKSHYQPTTPLKPLLPRSSITSWLEYPRFAFPSLPSWIDLRGW